MEKKEIEVRDTRIPPYFLSYFDSLKDVSKFKNVSSGKLEGSIHHREHFLAGFMPEPGLHLNAS